MIPRIVLSGSIEKKEIREHEYIHFVFDHRVDAARFSHSAPSLNERPVWKSKASPPILEDKWNYSLLMEEEVWWEHFLILVELEEELVLEDLVRILCSWNQIRQEQ